MITVTAYKEFFEAITANEPHLYQGRIAETLWVNRHLLIRVPTGCGKTLAVVAPFLFDRANGGNAIGARRLIYVLPMRTLVRSIERDICALIDKSELNCSVTVQTGEDSADPYLDQGDIVVTTFDQFLSGLLCGPYGLSDRQFNVNAAAAIGNLIVFDEFHLMEPDKAFLTTVAMMHLFRDWTRTVWMTATATSPLVDALRDALSVEEITLSNEDEAKIPAIAEVQRQIVRVHEPLTVEHLLRHKGKRVVAVVNQVKRAQRLFENLKQRHSELGIDTPIRCLHSRFFRTHRNATEEWLREAFGKHGAQPAVLITTQVVEAGVDISAEVLLTELAPANSLMQRAGRCARYAKQSGVVEVYDLPDTGKPHLPYEEETIRDTDQALSAGGIWSRIWADELNETVHRSRDAELVKHKWRIRLNECAHAIRARCMKLAPDGISRFIREGSDSVRVVVTGDYNLPHWKYESVQLYRDALRGLAAAHTDSVRRWDFDEQCWVKLSGADEISSSLIVAIAPRVAGYSVETGLRLLESSDQESPRATRRGKERPRPIQMEPWAAHALSVADRANKELQGLGAMLEDAPASQEALALWLRYAALSHDLGKLQVSWQRWARQYQLEKSGVMPTAIELLAHTDFDYANANDRLLSRSVRPVRPAHSAASTWYAGTVDWVPDESNDLMKQAALFAVVSHHGGWWNATGIEPLDSHAKNVCAVVGLNGFAESRGLGPGPADRFEKRWLEGPLSNNFNNFWPIASMFVRLLRIADQRSLEEANADSGN
jgi:CRISPR-associated endonuclease/helicase Cas3